MPLCPQITNTPITVSLTSDFTVTNVVPVLAANTEQLAATDANVAAAVATANAAAATAGTAQSTANTALANAATAYSAAIGSLQPSASTIVNASNQMTAIAANGITVYSGSSASSGARVVLNSLGLAGFDSGGTATFSISATTGAAVFSGSVTGSTITGGTLNIAGNAIINSSGLLTATGATITGTINATAGYFGTASNGFSINSTGLVGVGTGIIVGGTITTSSGVASVSLVGSTNSVNFRANSSNVAYLLPLNTGGGSPAYGLLMHYATVSGSNPTGAADPTGGTFPQMFVGSTNLSISASSTHSIGVSSSIGINLSASTGGINLNNQTNYPGVATGAGTSMVLVTTGSRIAIVTSSERFKEEIKYINTTGWLDKVMQMKPITYKTGIDFTTEGEPNETQIGFLAEDIYDIGGDLEKAVVLDPLGEPFSLSYDRLTVFLTLAIKELKAEIDQLKGE
jgi:hypothetical protein